MLAGGRRAGVGPAFVAFALVLAAAAFAAPTSALSPLPPEKAEIVFSNGGRIVSIKADGSQRKVLTRKRATPKGPLGSLFQLGLGGLGDVRPRMSPGGTRLLFERVTGDSIDMGVAQAESKTMLAGAHGGGPREILPDRGRTRFVEAN